jgi:hypothetical protein
VTRSNCFDATPAATLKKQIDLSAPDNFDLRQRKRALEASQPSFKISPNRQSGPTKRATPPSKPAKHRPEWHDHRETIAAMIKIEQSSKQIAGIIAVIDEIAFQTILLALNAGVEAARAGEAGKGFAVVAQEVRELAQRSAGAAREIKDLITALVSMSRPASNSSRTPGKLLKARLMPLT